VRQDDDVTKFKKEDGKKVVIPVDTAVDVTEIKVVGGAKYANVTDWGWTSLSNSTPPASRPRTATRPRAAPPLQRRPKRDPPCGGIETQRAA
jgi:hypothetical protein